MGRINEVIRLDRENGAASEGAGPALQKGDSGRLASLWPPTITQLEDSPGL